ncbi:MAG: protein of unknown function (DUF4339)/Yip1 domain-containing protein [Verrucomicrobia bacterium]|nr:MAG: protein of unknown function (DUF4339)/Yip1 domain-containing protein [Verrucomicrobiota bacterium]
MKWYYESNGQPHGPVQETELRQLKDEGKLLEESLIWRRGMEDWAPLHTQSEFSNRPESLPEGAKRLPSLEKTPRETASEQRSGVAEDRPAGSALQELLETSAPSESEPTGLDPISIHPEWERVKEVGPLRAFTSSVGEILLEPGWTFRHLNPSGGWGLPLMFLLICEVVGNILMILAVRQLPLSVSPIVTLLRQALHLGNLDSEVFVVSVASSAFMLPLAIVVRAVILHAAMKLLCRSQQPFSTTFRALCYALGAGSLLWGIPLAAVSIAAAVGEPSAALSAFFLAASAIGAWSIFLVLNALARAHGVPLWRTTLAVLLPPLLAAFLAVVFFGSLAALA